MTSMTEYQKEEIYKHERKLQLLMERIKKKDIITEKNKQLIEEYWNNGIARGLSKSRQEIILQSMMRMGETCLVDFDKATRKDMERALAELLKRSYSEWTVVTAKYVLKHFWRWMCKLESHDTLPDAVRWIKTSQPASKLTKNDLLTTEDITKMITSTGDLMQKTLISVHYEAANRPGETLSMRIGDVVFKEDYVLINVNGKTGRGEKFLLQSYDILRTYIENHPFKTEPDHPLWIVMSHQRVNRLGRDLYGKQISLAFMSKIIKDAAKKAGIKKNVYSYLCRHSQGTRLYGTIGGELAKKQMLHAPDSKMARVYCHLSSEDLLDDLRKANGIETKAEKEHNGVCWKCHHPNGFGAKICSRCASPLTIQAVTEKKQTNEKREEEFKVLQMLATKISSDPELLDTLLKKLPDVEAVK